MGQVIRTRDEVIVALVEAGTPKAKATMYADAYLEYQEASKNIEENGVIVLHPRTANPVENPYIAIRDRAAKRLETMRRVPADFLW